MPPLPKRRHSRSRSGMKAAHRAYRRPSLSRCTNCGSPTMPHIMCPVCGYYAGREIQPLQRNTEAAE